MANLVRKLYELDVVDASFIGLDSTPVMANTKQNNPKSNERRYEFYWGYKSHVLVDCISGLPLYELTTPGDEAFIPLNIRGTKDSKALSAGNPVREAGLAMHKDGKTTDNNRTRQKYCCPFHQSKTGVCPCSHKNWNNGKKKLGLHEIQDRSKRLQTLR